MNSEDIAFVVCYFNPLNYQSKYINFLLFYDRIKKTKGIKLVFVESYTDNCKLRINNNIDGVYSYHNNSFFWKKENLLNLGIKKLIGKYKYIGWLDSDIMFESSNWVPMIKSKLKYHNLVQVANIAKKQTPSGRLTEFKTMTSYYSDVSINLESTMSRLGEPGYGYVYNVDILNKDLPLYDKCICGGGDYINLISYIKGDEIVSKIKSDQERIFGRNKNMQIDFLNWANKNPTQKTIGCAKNTIIIKYHGSQRNRRYHTRDIIAEKYDFKPTLDTKYTKHGDLFLTRPDINDSMKNYFKLRNEDDAVTNTKYSDIFKSEYETMIRKYSTNSYKNLAVEYLPGIKLKSSVKTPILNNNTHNVCVKLKNDIKFAELIPNNPTIISDIGNKNVSYELYYLQYIINNYKRINKYTMFISDDTDGEYKFNNPKIINNTEDIVLRKDLHINLNNVAHRSSLNFKQWLAIFFKKRSLRYQIVKNEIKIVNTTTHKYVLYNRHSTYLVKGDYILKNKKEDYEKIHKYVTESNNDETLVYLKYSFPILFK